MGNFQQDALDYLRAWAHSLPKEIPDPEVWVRAILATPNSGVKQGLTLSNMDFSRQRWLKEQDLFPVITCLVNEAVTRCPSSFTDIESYEVGCQFRKIFGRFQYYETTGRHVAATLNKSGVEWAMIKGYPLSRQFYDQPFQRQLQDIDLLVAERDLPMAIKALEDIGGYHRSKTIETPEEQIIMVDNLEMDLHTQVMRTCRLRYDPVPGWLAKVQTHGPYRYLSDHDQLVLSLVHPAVTEYLTERISRMLDVLLQVVRCRAPIEWPRVADDVRRLGLANAAYATGIRVNHLFAGQHPPVIPPEFLETLGIDRWRKRYWSYWLDRRPDQIYKVSPVLARIAFSLWLNDAPRDWYRVLKDFTPGQKAN
jgi:hypothetical protein